jgi:capsid assembly protease
MSHEIDRVLRAIGTGYWFIDRAKADQIIGMIALRAATGPRADTGYAGAQPVALVDDRRRADKLVRGVRLHGTITPRGNMMSEMSGAVSLDQFQQAFRQAAEDPAASAILIDVDSPGGNVAQVPETVALIRSYKREGRPIVAFASGMMCSAAYWIASAADEIVATTSAEIGSIGVYMMHSDLSERLKAQGVKTTFIYEGPRKVEGNQTSPLDDDARAYLQEGVKHYYDLFTADVAKGRGVPVSVVKADPVTAEAHFGGGRSYPAARAAALGMIDRVATFDETITRLTSGGSKPRRASIERRKLALS